MNVTFYQTRSEKNAISKSLTGLATKTGNLSNDCDVINPVINFDYDENLYSKNYARIPSFGRYYFIDDIVVNNGMMEVHFHCDVLMTYAQDIASSTAHITRSSNGNKYIADSMVTPTSKTAWQFRSLGTCLQAECNYILIKTGI